MVTKVKGVSTELMEEATVVAEGSSTSRSLGNRAGDVSNFKDHGAVGDGVTNDGQAFRNVESTTTGRVFLPASPTPYVLADGSYTNRGIDGNNQEFLGKLIMSRPETNLWKYTAHRDFIISNPNGTCIETDNSDPFAGRHIFENVFAHDADIGFHQTQGAIGCGYYRVSTSNCAIGYRADDSSLPTVTHAGAMRMEQAHFSGCDVAGIYVNDQTDGLGGYSFNDIIVEDGNGFGIFLKSAQHTPFNKVKIDGFWCENDPRGQPQVDIDGTLYTPRVIRIEDFRSVTITDSYIYDAEIINSDVILERCRIDVDFLFPDLAIDIDDSSSVTAHNLVIGNSGTANQLGNMLTTSIAKCSVNSSFRNVAVRMPCPTKGFKDVYASTLLGEQMDTVQVWPSTAGGGTLTGVLANDPTTSGKCNIFTIPSSGLTLFSPTINLNVANGKWITWSVSLKVDDGAVDAIWQQNFTLGVAYTKVGQWVTTRGIQEVVADGNTTRLWITATGGTPATVRVADIYIKYHETEAEALAAINSNAIYYR